MKERKLREVNRVPDDDRLNEAIRAFQPQFQAPTDVRV
jgi:hypothetical protein